MRALPHRLDVITPKLVSNDFAVRVDRHGQRSRRIRSCLGPEHEASPGAVRHQPTGRNRGAQDVVIVADGDRQRIVRRVDAGR